MLPRPRSCPIVACLLLLASGCGAVSPFRPNDRVGEREVLTLQAIDLSTVRSTHGVDSPGSPERGFQVVACNVEALPSGPLSYLHFVDLAVQFNPDLRVAEAQVTAARGRLIQAGLYPNPTVGWEASDLGTLSNAAGKQGPTLSQTIVTADKLRIARAAASHGVSAADWQAVTRWFDVLSRLRAAFYDALAAQREVEVNEELVRIAGAGHSAAEKLHKAGTVGLLDVLRAQVELDQFRNRLEVARRRAEASWRLLVTTAGLDNLPTRPLDGRLDDETPDYDFDQLQSVILRSSSEVLAAQAAAAEAQELVRRARAEVVPNVQVFVQPQYDFTEQHALGQVGIRAPLPVFDRNQGNILAAEAEAARTREVVRQTELRLTERLTLSFQRYQAAREQLKNFERHILPNAKESLRLVLIGYESGDPKYDYTAVLQAQNILAQARLTYVQVQGEVQRAVSELEGLLQRDPAEFFLKQAQN